jgi:hypothetical protein
MNEDEEEEEQVDNEDKLADFKKGVAEYLLTKFYVKKKKEAKGE